MKIIKTRFSFLIVLLLMSIPAHVVFAFESEIETISKEIATELKEKQLDTIAVSDFTDLQGNVTELGRYLAEKTSIVLATSADGFNVVDRTHLKTLLKEHKLSASGVIDPATARKLGKIAGVKALVTGSLVPIGDQVDLTVKVLNTETANILLAQTQKLAKTEALIQLMKRNVVSTGNTETRKEGAKSASKSKNTELHAKLEKEQTNIKIRLLKCKHKENNIKCIFDVTYTGKEASVRADLHKQSYMYDENLDQYSASAISFGGVVSDENDRYVYTSLVPEETEKGYLLFSEILSNPKIVSVTIVVSEGRKFSFNDIQVE